MSGAESEQIVFDEVQIGRRMWPLAQHGFIVVTPTTLSLLGSDEQLIDSAPTAEVTADKVLLTFNLGISMKVNGTTYWVTPGYGYYMPATPPPWARDIRQAGDRLVRLVQAARNPRDGR